MDGFKRFKRKRRVRAARASDEEENKSLIDKQHKEEALACKAPLTATSTNNISNNEDADIEKSFQNEIIVGPGDGKLLDRHFFSMLCYENFATFHHFLYFKSICKATFFAHRIDSANVFPLIQGIIKQWCHEDNFSGRFLVIRYYVRHVIAILLSLAALRFSAFVLDILGSDPWTYDSFR